MNPECRHHIRNAVLCLKYLLRTGDTAGAMEQVKRIDCAMKLIDLKEAREKRTEAEANSEAIAIGWAYHDELAEIVDMIPRSMVLRIMSVCRQSLQSRGGR